MGDNVIRFKRGSTKPVYIVALYRVGDPKVPLVLTDATVRLIARDRLSDDVIINQELEIVDPFEGVCRYVRGTEDFVEGADCNAEFIVTYSGGDVLILPTSGRFRLIIEESLIE